MDDDYHSTFLVCSRSQEILCSASYVDLSCMLSDATTFLISAASLIWLLSCYSPGLLRLPDSIVSCKTLIFEIQSAYIYCAARVSQSLNIGCLSRAGMSLLDRVKKSKQKQKWDDDSARSQLEEMFSQSDVIKTEFIWTSTWSMVISKK